MAASMSQSVDCRICKEKVPSVKRRAIYSTAFHVFNQLSQVLCYNPKADDGLSKNVCLKCFGKLNKLAKIDHDLQHRLDALRQEKSSIIQTLRSNLLDKKTGKLEEPPASKSQQADDRTPKKSQEKRKTCVRSPTPRKPKKALLSTPKKHGHKLDFGASSSKPLQMDSAEILARPITDAPDTPAKRKEPSEHTYALKGRFGVQLPKKTQAKQDEILFSPEHMRVQHRVKGGAVRTRTIYNTDLKAIVCSIYRGDSAPCLAKKIFKSHLKASLTDCFLKQLNSECKTLRSRNVPILLQRVKPENLTSMKFSAIDLELQTSAPLFHQTLTRLTMGNLTHTTVAAAVILFSRNNKMSLLQHVIGQVLDHCGATDEAISTLNKLGVSVAARTVAAQRQQLQDAHEKQVKEMFGSDDTTQEGKIGTSHSVEIIGDNIDITRTPSQMSKEHRTKSWHWFLLMGMQKRVLFPNLQDERPRANVMDISNGTFVPDLSDCNGLENDFVHHMMHIMVTYVQCLRNMKSCLPSHINHPYEDQTSTKSVYTVLDLLDKSENKTDEMISILEHVHEKYIPHSGDPPTVLQKKVFGGDCLTNERAYSAQLALFNSPTDHTMLKGVIHRPEGLHRMMNLCLFIYQQFYKPSSCRDPGTIYQLRNVLKRTNVQGGKAVIGSYRAHYSFLQDCLDGYVLAACMELMGLNELDGEPTQDLSMLMNDKLKLEFLTKLAKDILNKFLKLSDVEDITEATDTLDTSNRVMEQRFDTEKGRYVCECGKSYKSKGYFERHVKSAHNNPQQENQQNRPEDHIAQWRSSFMKCALLLRDTNDAYKQGDGRRIARNAKFEMLLCDVGHHTKYKLWLFRFQAYISAILSDRQAMEYMWNCTSNTRGGAGKNIPNDNLVEMTVQAVKKKIHQQGANATFQSARSAALSMNTQTDIKDNLMRESNTRKSGKTRTFVDKSSDLKAIIGELKKSEVFKHVPGRSFDGFRNFEEVFSRVNNDLLYKWISDQKKRISFELL